MLIKTTHFQTRFFSISLFLLVFSFAGTSLAETPWPWSPPDPEAAGFSKQGIDRLNTAMEKIVSDQDVAGMTWLLAKDGKVATFETRGYAAIDQNKALQKDSLFRIYSMTKPITGVALMILHEKGLWDFDDPISKFIPEFAELQVMTSYDEEGNFSLAPLKRQPTMRELLNHSAGFGYGLGGSDPVNEKFRETEVLNSADLDQLIERVADIPLLFQPGEQWRYSIAVDIQGYIVQKLSGQQYGDFLQENIFKPLGMRDTRFYVRPQDKHLFAEVHNWDKDKNALVERPIRTDRPDYHDPNRLESGGGGLVSSTHDYARFLQMLVNGGEFEGERIISEASVKQMRTNTLRDGLLIRQTNTNPGSPGVGFGVDFAVIFDPEAAETPNGKGTYYWAGAAGTWFWIDPENDMFWVAMIQAQGARRPGAANMRNIARDLIYQAMQ